MCLDTHTQKKKCLKALRIGRRSHLVQSHNFHEEKSGLSSAIKFSPCLSAGELLKCQLWGWSLWQRERNCTWILVGILALHDKAPVIDGTWGWVWRSADLSDAWACQLTNESQGSDLECGHALMAWSRKSQHWLTRTCVHRRWVLLLWGDKGLWVCANIH